MAARGTTKAAPRSLSGAGRVVLLLAGSVAGTWATWNAYAPESIGPRTVPLMLLISAGVALFAVLAWRMPASQAFLEDAQDEPLPVGAIVVGLVFAILAVPATIKYGVQNGIWLDVLVCGVIVAFAVAWWWDR